MQSMKLQRRHDSMDAHETVALDHSPILRGKVLPEGPPSLNAHTSTLEAHVQTPFPPSWPRSIYLPLSHPIPEPQSTERAIRPLLLLAGLGGGGSGSTPSLLLLSAVVERKKES